MSSIKQITFVIRSNLSCDLNASQLRCVRVSIEMRLVDAYKTDKSLYKITNFSGGYRNAIILLF